MTSDLKLGLALAEAHEFAQALGPAVSAGLVQGRWQLWPLGWDWDRACQREFRM